MRSFLVAFAGLMLIATGAQAKVAITVDKDSQQMTVEVDGVTRYRWPVSSGIPSYETPNGSFRAFRMEADHYSKEFDDAPMPLSLPALGLGSGRIVAGSGARPADTVAETEVAPHGWLVIDPGA